MPTAALALNIRPVVINGIRATVCVVDPVTDHLGLFWKDDSGQPLRNFDALAGMLSARDKRLLFAMNAGMYEEDFSPLGLFISGGKRLAPINLRSATGNFYLKPNGVFLVSHGHPAIVDSSSLSSFAGHPDIATQSGPLLVIHGRIHPAFNPTSISRLYRNGVGVTSSGKVIFAIAEQPVNFYEFATLFRDGLKCPDALFLDGNVSSLYAPSLGRDDRRRDLGPMICVTR